MRNKLIMNYPASWWAAKWREAIPLGNGSIGAAVYGAVHEETILINHEDLWINCIKQNLPDVSEKLPIVRENLFRGEIEKAENIISDALREKGYKHSTAAPLPLGDFKIIMPVEIGFKDYSRVLDMEQGEAIVSWRSRENYFERRTFVSRADNVIAIKISNNLQDNLNADFWLDIHEPNDSYKPFGEKSAALPRDVQIQINDNYIFYSAKNDDDMDFGAVGKIVADKGKVECIEDRIRVSNADCITVLIKVFVKGQRKENWQSLKNDLCKLNKSYEKMLESHYKIHEEMFNSAKFSLSVSKEMYALSNEQLLLDAYKGMTPDVLTEKLWSYGRYLLISSSREGGQPCPLLGLWAGEYDAMFSFNMANENIQMIYWQALAGNIPKVLFAMFDYYESMMDQFRINARNLYGCRGIYIPAVSTPGEGLLQHLGAHIIYWTGAAGWLAQHYYDYFLFTDDKEFLARRAIPFMKEVALFYSDFFIIGDDGLYISIPSVSPENTPVNISNEDRNTDKSFSTAINATMDFAIAKELLTNLIEGAQIIGGMEEDINSWCEMMTHIPFYEINEDSAIKEWMHPLFKDNYHHRHQSHVYPVFPGYEVTEERNPELFKAFTTAIKKRLAVGLTSQTSWSFAHMACNYARMGEGDLALECLDNISRSALMNNFLTVHNDWRSMGIGLEMNMAPFQIDANMGWTCAVQEMLLFSRPGFLKVLPALPKKWTKGSIGGLLSRGSIQVSILWDTKESKIELTLCSNKNQVVDIKLPYCIKLLKINDEKSSDYNKNMIEGFKVVKSQTYRINILLENSKK